MLKPLISNVEKTIYAPNYVVRYYSLTSLPLLAVYLVTHYAFQLKLLKHLLPDMSVYYYYFIPDCIFILIIFVIDNWNKCEFVEGFTIDALGQATLVWSTVETLFIPIYLIYGMDLTVTLNFWLLLAKGIVAFFIYNWSNNFRWYYNWSFCNTKIHDTKLPFKEDYVDVYYKDVYDVLTPEQQLKLEEDNDITPFVANIIDMRAEYKKGKEKDYEILHKIKADALA